MTAPISLTDGKLTAEHVQNYWDDGFLFPIPVVEPLGLERFEFGAPLFGFFR